jgi:threonine synthase
VIEHPPRLVAVQAEACAPIAAAHLAGEAAITPVSAMSTVADGIAIAAPVRGAQVLSAVRGSGGTVVAVDDDAIVAARDELATQGVQVEPTAAATVAGAEAWLATLDRDPGRIALPLSGAATNVPS